MPAPPKARNPCLACGDDCEKAQSSFGLKAERRSARFAGCTCGGKDACVGESSPHIQANAALRRPFAKEWKIERCTRAYERKRTVGADASVVGMYDGKSR